VKKPLFLIIAVLFFTAAATAQKIASSDLKILRQKEDSLKKLAKDLIVDSLTAQRMRSDSLFIRTLVRSLQVKNSFYFPFDQVQGISKLYAPDSTFRIFSWSISFDDYYSRQRGAIQFKTSDGSLRLVPLRDFSEFTPKPTDSLRTKDNWIGSVYYKIIKNQYNGKNYYTLFGFDNYSVRSNKKWIDVLSFDNRNMPVFGGTFSFEQDSAKKSNQARFNIEYKKEASTTVNYDADLNMILVDHLISESNEPDKPYTYIPDGDYEGFQWQKGKWVHIDKVFNQKLEDGQAPIPDPILDTKGNPDEQKLQMQSEKNKSKK
jgi:hypothetical protein